jgi:hypothetical protein
MESTEGQSYLIDAPADAAQLELHVFARAYRSVWIALKGQPPLGRHRFPSLQITIEFAEPCKAL